MSIAAVTAPVAPMLRIHNVYTANAATVAPVPTPAAEPARGRDLPAVSPVPRIVLQANATATARNAAYDCRVTGATETVRNFDRVAMVKEGFAHMRTLFDLANGGENTPAFTMLDARV